MNDKITAYDIIADIADLVQIKDNVYVDPNSIKYYRDRLGFHTIIQYSSNSIIEKEDELNKREKVVRQLEDKYQKVLKREEIALHKKNIVVIKHILNSNLTADEKLEHISMYLNSKS